MTTTQSHSHAIPRLRPRPRLSQLGGGDRSPAERVQRAIQSAAAEAAGQMAMRWHDVWDHAGRSAAIQEAENDLQAVRRRAATQHEADFCPILARLVAERVTELRDLKGGR